MEGFQMLLLVVAVNAGVLGVGLLTVYQLNSAVKASGR
jgi:hypothetical protein